MVLDGRVRQAEAVGGRLLRSGDQICFNHRELAVRSRWRLGSLDNYGGFQIIDSEWNAVAAGSRFDMDYGDVERLARGVGP